MRRDLQSLVSAIQAIQHRAPAQAGDGDSRLHLSTGWPGIDEALGGGLMPGSVHEWFVDFRFSIFDSGLRSGAVHPRSPTSDPKSQISDLRYQISDRKSSISNFRSQISDFKSDPQPSIQNPKSKIQNRTDWFAPFSIFIHLAWRAVADQKSSSNKLVLWIGRRCWPYARALIRDAKDDDRALLKRSLCVDPPDDATRLWAIDLALRSPAVALVAADGSGLEMAESRRLQLAAESGGALALLARPPNDLAKLSAAMTRWLVRPTPSHDCNPRWSVDLLRCKGVRPVVADPPPAAVGWVLEWDDAKGTVNQLADVVGGPGAAAPPEPVDHECPARRSA